MDYENCCGPVGFGMRRYLTKEEKLERLKVYQGQLESEIQAVKERIKGVEKE